MNEKSPLSEGKKIAIISGLSAFYLATVVSSSVLAPMFGAQNQSLLGTPVGQFFGYPLYLLPLGGNIVLWYIRYGKTPGVQALFQEGWIWFASVFAVTFAGSFFGFRALFRKTSGRKTSDTTYGSSRFATESDLQKLSLLVPRNPSMVIGAVPAKLPSTFDHASFLKNSERSQGGKGPETDAEKKRYEKSVRILYNTSPAHVLALAPTRSGKGVGLVVPTLLEWSHSSVVLDIKGENYHLSSGYRQKSGQRVLRFKPTDPNSNRVSKYNPLAEIKEATAISQAQDIANVLSDPDGTANRADFWFTSSSDLLSALILFSTYRMFDKSILSKREMSPASLKAFLDIPWDNASLGTVAAIISSPLGKDHSEWMSIIVDMAEASRKKYIAAHPGKSIPEYYNYVIRQADTIKGWPMEQASGTLGHTKSHMSLFTDPIIAANTGQSDWTCLDLMGVKEEGKDVPVSLYLIVNPGEELIRLRPLLRIIVSQIVANLTGEMEYDADGSQKTKGPFKLLMLLDEFPQLGKLKAIEDAMAFTAGYGIYFYLIVQDSVQLDNIYGQNNSIVSNCHIKIAYAANRPETSKAIAEMLGQTTVVKELSSYSKGQTPFSVNESRSTSLFQRSLLTADEVMRIPFDRSLILMANAFPIYGKKVFFYAIRKYIERSKLPEAIPYSRTLPGRSGETTATKDDRNPEIHRMALKPEASAEKNEADESPKIADAKREDMEAANDVLFGESLERAANLFAGEEEQPVPFEKSPIYQQLEKLAAKAKQAQKEASVSDFFPLSDPAMDAWTREWLKRNRKATDRNPALSGRDGR